MSEQHNEVDLVTRWHRVNVCVDPLHPIITLREQCRDPECREPHFQVTQAIR